MNIKQLDDLLVVLLENTHLTLRKRSDGCFETLLSTLGTEGDSIKSVLPPRRLYSGEGGTPFEAIVDAASTLKDLFQEELEKDIGRRAKLIEVLKERL